MVELEAIFHRVIKESFPEEVIFDLTPEDKKETDMCRLFQALGTLCIVPYKGLKEEVAE